MLADGALEVVGDEEGSPRCQLWSEEHVGLPTMGWGEPPCPRQRAWAVRVDERRLWVQTAMAPLFRLMSIQNTDEQQSACMAIDKRGTAKEKEKHVRKCSRVTRRTTSNSRERATARKRRGERTQRGRRGLNRRGCSWRAWTSPTRCHTAPCPRCEGT